MSTVEQDLGNDFESYGLVIVDGAWAGELLSERIPLKGEVDVAKPRRSLGGPKWERVRVDARRVRMVQ